ncbi:alkaline phosphatase [Fulvivirga ligni]|uniref:alkaline phosphatase n=1 Tax=Fulvivirga ligni TaxID=2904246 RepID=UPI001F3EF03C|nr:alkaline phosphatase [Fulvivirga ligni]UII20865.1 alkaline phosphatase [Fulvivirga ligni]
MSIQNKLKTFLCICVVLMMSACNQKMADGIDVNQAQVVMPPNIILLIGDGMGVPQISTAYYFGDEKSNFSQFKHIGFHKTSDKEYKITDSAAGATAFSTGEKTYKRAIGVGVDTTSRETILEYLQKQGYKTGLISLTTVTHATPASFYAHVPDRDMHEEIAAQLPKAKIDFIAGGGRNFFGKRKDSVNLYQHFIDMDYHIDTMKLSEPVMGKPNIYLLSDESMPSKVQGRGDFLPKATEKALNYFKSSKQPFFMMVEESYIDWAGHDENEEMLIAEVEDMDNTLGVIQKFVRENPNTLLVVTADHETGGVSIGKFYDTDENGNKIENPEKVKIYFNSNQHSGELIPVFAMGTGAEIFQGIYENNEIFHKIKAICSQVSN